MTAPTTAPPIDHRLPTRPVDTSSLRTPALVGGCSLLALAVLAGWAILGVVETLVTEGDAARTARDILASAGTFRAAVAALFLTAALDVVVAWSLWRVLAPVHRAVSAVAGLLRTVYAAFLLTATISLAGVVEVLEGVGSSTTLAAVETTVLELTGSFGYVWDLGLLVFGLHLVLVGWLVHRSDYAPRWLGVLLVVAGAGYVLDSVVAVFAPGSLPVVTVYTFVGEVALIVWLLTRGRKVRA